MSDERPGAWGELNARYGQNEDAQFLLLADQLVEIRGLLVSGTIAKLRLALVAIDNLASVVLYRHLRRIDYLAQHRAWGSLVPRLNDRMRGRFRSDFSFQVELGRKGDAGSLSVMTPILTEFEATIFRTGHAYRNRVYHADHHNARVLPLVARLYAAAVARAWVHQQPTQSGSSMTAGFRDQLDRLGYGEAERAKGQFGAGYWQSVDAARVIAARLIDDLQPTLDGLRGELIDDLLWRTAWAEEMVDDLARDNDREWVERTVRWIELWDEIGDDAELVKLSAELDELDNTFSTDFQRKQALTEARNARFNELRTAARPTFTLRDVELIAAAARKLRTAADSSTVLLRYEQLDRRIAVIERRLDEAAIAWDEHIQQETDAYRGK
jgi:hypothetical protein